MSFVRKCLSSTFIAVAAFGAGYVAARQIAEPQVIRVAYQENDTTKEGFVLSYWTLSITSPRGIGVTELPGNLDCEELATRFQKENDDVTAWSCSPRYKAPPEWLHVISGDIRAGGGWAKEIPPQKSTVIVPSEIEPWQNCAWECRFTDEPHDTHEKPGAGYEP